MTVMVFTFVLLLGNALKEILPLLVSGQVSLVFVAQSVGLLVPFVWVFALPMGMLTATLLVFGRFSADQEYTAARASGISLLSVSTPILLLSVALCGVSALINMELGPRCRVAYTSLLARLRAEFSAGYLPERTPIKDFPDHIFYVGKNRKGELEDIWIFKLATQTNVEQTVHARRGKLEVDAPNKQLVLTLYDGQGLAITGNQPAGSFEETSIELPLEQKRPGTRAAVDDMSFSQLRNELASWEQRLTLPISLKNLTPEQRQARRRELEQARKEFTTPLIFHMHRQVAFSFACFGFTLVGIPLGIRVHRRETNIGIALALVLVALYYSFILFGQSLNTRPEYLPHLLVWIPNFLFQSIGIVLLWRANRGL
jgi:lipopolysaccharide export system permease protein